MAVRPGLIILLLAALLLALFLPVVVEEQNLMPPGNPVAGRQLTSAAQSAGSETGTAGSVLDISVHTLEELQVLLDRAEALVSRQQSEGNDSRVVLVLHGPEVEFFSTRNYDIYKDVVDRAARLDAIDVVDVRICQTMMRLRGIGRDDIPPFVEQVPDGQLEINRLLGSGYVYF